MAFKNRIRLPFKLTRPQYAEERQSFRKSDGVTKTLSVVVRKTYEGETDWISEKIHERLKIALAHDNITIEGDKYLGGIAQEGDYEIQWQDFLDYPTAKAKFKVNVTPFDATNSNCQSCEEATQLSVVDDAFESPLEEDTQYTLNVAENDDICCYPALFTITYYNSTYLSSASIDQDGIISIQTKTDLIDATNLLLLTYRVTCPNGGYDEGNVYADINGSLEPACNAPEKLSALLVDSGSASVTWDAPTPAPVQYIWELYDLTNPGPAIQSGTTTDTSLSLTGLSASNDYQIFVKSDCGGNESAFVDDEFTTPASNTSGLLCGRYAVANTEFDTSYYREVTYMDCNGVYQTVRVYGQGQALFCAAQTGPGSPIYIHSNPTESNNNGDSRFATATIIINYVYLC